MTTTLLVLALALVIDRIVGDPPRLWSRVLHPVVLFGWAISAFEHLFNGKRMHAATRRFNGAVSIGALLLASLLVGHLIHAALLGFGWLGLIVEAVVASVFFAQKSLADHVGAVATGLRRGGLAGRLDRTFERAFNAMLQGYNRSLKVCLRHRPTMLVLFLATFAIAAYQFATIPKGFFPQEDIGQLLVTTRAREDVSYAAMSDLQAKVEAVFAASPYVAHVASSVGTAGGAAAGLNSGRLFVELKPKNERPPLQVVLSRLRAQLATIPGIQAFMTPAQNLSVGSRASASQYQLIVQSLDEGIMNSWADRLYEAMRGDRAYFADVSSDLQNNAPQTRLLVDRDKASVLGVSAGELRSTLYDGFGTEQISTIYTPSDSYEVIMELDPAINWSAARLAELQVGTAGGGVVPLGAFARIETLPGPLTINQLGQLPAVTISYNLPDRVALGDSVREIDHLKAQIGMPPDVTTRFYGTAQLFQDAAANQGLLILAAVVTIYIVLGVLYESFIHPLTVLSGLPSAASGALLALWLFGFDLSIIAVIGLLMLIGIVKKNAIMMIDVALSLQRDGIPALEAIHRACLMRFRPSPRS